MTEERQLSLLKGKRQKGEVPPSPSEFAVHVALADTLRRFCLPGWIWWHHPAGGKRPQKMNPKTGQLWSPEGERLRRMGAKPGIADFIFVGRPCATVYAYELKRFCKKPTEEQLQWGAQIIAAGGCWAWGDTFDHAITTWKDWGILPKGIKVQ